MYGTSLGGIEQLMMLAPNFTQRRSGIVINNHFNCEGGIKICNGCVEKDKSRGNPNDWFCLREKLEADEIGYMDLIRDCFGSIKNYALRERLKLLSNRFTGQLFSNHNHKERFYRLIQKQDIDICKC